jgi:hypothetical protein
LPPSTPSMATFALNFAGKFRLPFFINNAFLMV